MASIISVIQGIILVTVVSMASWYDGCTFVNQRTK